MRHYQALNGAWSFALRPYYNNNITQLLVADDVYAIANYEDPYRYRSRVNGIPKLIINAAGDEFFFAQDTHSWWDDIGGPKWIMMNPNAEHVLFPHWLRIYSNICGWVLTLVNEGVNALPVVEWERQETENAGSITMTTSTPPDDIRGLRAETLDGDDMRDFRLIAGYPDTGLKPVWWRNTTVTEVNDGLYEYYENTVEDKWVGFFIEGTWETAYGHDMYFTTEAQIIPDTYPAEPCTSAEECYSRLV